MTKETREATGQMRQTLGDLWCRVEVEPDQAEGRMADPKANGRVK